MKWIIQLSAAMLVPWLMIRVAGWGYNGAAFTHWEWWVMMGCVFAFGLNYPKRKEQQ